MKKTILLLMLLIFLANGRWAAAEQSAQDKPAAFLVEQAYEFPPVVEGTRVVHDFVLQNKGSAPLEIKKLSSG